MNGSELLSNVVAYTSYARYDDKLGRRETWGETVSRYFTMLSKKYEPYFENNTFNTLFLKSYDAVNNKEILPSMRMLQFGGKSVEISPNRGYNCSYMPIDSIHSFSEAMFLLLGGSGVGYSVQDRHISKLPKISKANKKRRYLVGDSIEGWSDSVKALMKGYFGLSKTRPKFDFSDIRPKGARLKTSGGKAPGPQPLHDALHKIEAILSAKENDTYLTSVEAHDMMCHIADAVLSGGIRRAAMIALFDFNDWGMMECKSGNWWELNPQRARANNSVSLLRHDPDLYDKMMFIKERNIINGYGEPGILLTNDQDLGTNPCAEISLRPFQFCNLTNINLNKVTDKNDLFDKAVLASFIGTLQAGFTDFHYLRDIWQQTTEEDALLGVGLTGIASVDIKSLNISDAAGAVRATNKIVSGIIGINSASRTTCVKPDGNTGALLGSSSGIHPWHSEYYIRHKRLNKIEPLYHYMVDKCPELVEDDVERPSTQAVLKFPVKAPEGAILRSDEVATEFLERVKYVYDEWVVEGHRKGANTHNVSCTVSVRDDEWDAVFDWMKANKNSFSAISLLPYSDIKYKQAPFQEVSKEEYEELESKVKKVKLSDIVEHDDNTAIANVVACGGGGCEV